jgi:hypothetical protein
MCSAVISGASSRSAFALARNTVRRAFAENELKKPVLADLRKPIAEIYHNREGTPDKSANRTIGPGGGHSCEAERPSLPKDLSPEQRAAIEGLLGPAVSENEEISIQTVPLSAPPDWLKAPWETAKRQRVDQLSTEEVDAEIAAARKTRREGQPSD